MFTIKQSCKFRYYDAINRTRPYIHFFFFLSRLQSSLECTCPKVDVLLHIYSYSSLLFVDFKFVLDNVSFVRAPVRNRIGERPRKTISRRQRLTVNRSQAEHTQHPAN